MKSYTKLLTILVQITIFVLGAFDSFLTRVAPPSEVGAFYPIGIMSFLMLILLLIVSVLSDREAGGTAWRFWLFAGIVFFLLAVPAAIVYPALLGCYTYPSNTALQDRKVKASDEFLTPEAAEFKRTSNPKPSDTDLEQSLPDGKVWTPAGQRRARLLLLAGYAWLVLSLSGAIFCLLEARLRKDRRAGQPE
jgi:hypothetical protein